MVCVWSRMERNHCADFYLLSYVCIAQQKKKKSLHITHSMPFLCKAHVQYALILACKCCNYMDTSPQHVSFGCSREHQVFPNVSCERARLSLPVGSQISADIHATLLIV